MCKISKPIINLAATAARIKSYRLRCGYSVREIQAIFSFNSAEAIYSWEKGKYLPTIDNLIVLAAVYGVTVDDIIVRDEIEIECELDLRDEKSA